MKRPILSREQRAELHRIAGKVASHTDGTARAYATGVLDVLDWLTGSDPSPLLSEVTR